MKRFFDDVTIKTIIGDESHIVGDMEVSGVLRLDGDVDGNVSSNACIMIGEKARISGNIKADSVISRGIVKGNILADKSVSLYSSAVVIGDVLTKKINIQEGVFIEGHCFAVDDDILFESRKSEYLLKETSI